MLKPRKNYIEYKIIEVFERRYVFIPETLLFFRSSQKIEEILVKYNSKSEREILDDYREDEEVKTFLNELKEIQGEIGLRKRSKGIEKEEITIKSIELNVAQACNLRCKYCLAHDGSHGNEQIMSIEKAREIVERLFDRGMIKSDFAIIFIGGEPLLNLPVIEFVLEYATKRAGEIGVKIDYAMTTNGTKLTEEVMRLFKKYNVDILLSMDSMESTVHDRLRPTVNGKGSYALIKENGWKALTQSDNRYSVQMTVTPCNLDIFENSKQFYESGFSHVQIEKVKSDEQEFTFKAGDYEKIGEEFKKLVPYLLDRIEKRYNISNHPLLSYLDFLHLHNKMARVNRCSLLYNSMSISADGGFYPCDGLMWDDYKIGNIADGVDYERVKLFKKELLDHSRCRSCWARNLCDKGCVLEKKAEEGSYKYPDCELKQLVCKLQLYIYDYISEVNPEYLERFELPR